MHVLSVKILHTLQLAHLSLKVGILISYSTIFFFEEMFKQKIPTFIYIEMCHAFYSSFDTHVYVTSSPSCFLSHMRIYAFVRAYLFHRTYIVAQAFHQIIS